jgi:hypothetical protein
MTIENNLASIAKSLELIAAALTQKNANPTPVAAPTQPVSVPVVVAPVAAPVVQQASVMPAPPVFQTPAPVATPTPAPVAAPVQVASPSVFADKNAMMDFVLTSYKALGSERGAKIQDVLGSMGYRNINDVPPESWGQLKAGIEGL